MTGTPITVFTGYLGAGKTSIILDLVKQLPPDYRCVLLKNEYGDVAVDAELARASQIQVKEIVNGCLCCVLVGRMEFAIDELIETYHPDRILIETSGSAYPAPIAVQLHHMGERVHLDAIVTVVDALNFPRYQDKSFTARGPLKYTDLILVNKHELVDEKRLDAVMDDLYDMNMKTPKVKTNRGHVPADLIFGLDTKLFNDETTLTVMLADDREPDHQRRDIEVVQLKTDIVLDASRLEILLASLDAEYVYRVKGIVIKPEGGARLLNFVAGRWDWTDLKGYRGQTAIAFMGTDVGELAVRLPDALGVPVDAISRPA
jgi:G3E family GTPase